MFVDLRHLAGPNKGSLRRGRGPVIEIDGDRARIHIDGDTARLQATEPVRVNANPVAHAVLHDGDILELNEETRLQVRLVAEQAAQETGEHEMPVETDSPAPAADGRGARMAILFSVLLSTVTATVAILGYLAWQQRAQLQSESFALRIEQERLDGAVLLANSERAVDEELTTLRGRIANMKAEAVLRGAKGDQTRRLTDDVRQKVDRLDREWRTAVPEEIKRSLGAHPQLQATRAAVARMESDRSAVERILARYSNSVCFIQGAYGFAKRPEEDSSGKSWRFLKKVSERVLREIEPAGDKVPLTLDGDGPIFEVEYTGTGFLVDKSGIIMTNRHIAEPWWKNESAEPLIREGFTPRFLYLRAYFPDSDEPIRFDRHQTILSTRGDVALLQYPAGNETREPLELARGKPPIGRRVLLLGYPSGMNALLAKSEENFARDLIDDDALGSVAMLDALAAHGAVRPLPSHGHISDVLGEKILYDAPTAVGGSGGPVVDLEGHVVAVNYGILKSFKGANFGVPIEMGIELLHRAK
ncbi:MAG: serine protease [Planctomycetota bacterium]